MYPYLYIGELKISLYYSAMILGYVMMIVMMLLKKRRAMYGISRRGAVYFATMGLICGVLGCKILYILENFSLVQKNGITLGGFSFYGAVFLTPFLMPLFGKVIKLNWRASMDIRAFDPRCVTCIFDPDVAVFVVKGETVFNQAAVKGGAVETLPRHG